MEFMCSGYRLLVIMSVAICLKLHFGLGTEIYIKSSSNSLCSIKTCLTLSQFSTKSVLDSLSQNTTLLFPPGDYTLESKISITNTSNFSESMISRTSNVSIFCHQHASFKFEGINKVSIKGFKFIGCGSNRLELVKDFLLENTSFIGGNGSATALEIDKIKACIIDTSFMYNTVGSLRGPIRILHGSEHQCAYVGGAIITNQSNVTVIRSEFSGNGAKIGGAMFTTQGSKVVIENSSFIGNSAVNCSIGLCFGGAVYVEDGTNQPHAILTKTTVMINECEFRNNAATNGGILTVFNSTVYIFLSKVHINMAERFGGAI